MRLSSALLYLPPALFITGPCGASSLYERMGGAANVAATVDDVVDHAASDPRTRRSFEDVNLKRIKQSLAVLICDLSGGGCKYAEDSMRDVHAGLRITQAPADTRAAYSFSPAKVFSTKHELSAWYPAPAFKPVVSQIHVAGESQTRRVQIDVAASSLKPAEP